MLSAVLLMGVDFAHLWKVRGKVYVVRAGSVQEARKGMPLKVGDVIKVGDRAYAAVKYYDGSYLKLSSGSLLKVKETSGVYLSSGRLFSRIKKKLGKKGFYVATQTAVAGVRGTRFEVSIEGEGEVKVSVYEGKVEVVDLKTMKKQLVLEGKALKLSVKEGVQELSVDPKEMKSFWKSEVRDAKKYEKELREVRKEAMEQAKGEAELEVREMREAQQEMEESIAEVRKEAESLESELEDYKEALDEATKEFQEETEGSMEGDGGSYEQDFQNQFPMPGQQ